MSLSADELTSMRETLTASLPDVCTIRRNTPVSDGAGGQADSWADLAVVACRVSPLGQTPWEKAVAERLSGVSTWTITLPAMTDVTARDRIAVGSRVFEVAAVLARSDEISRRVAVVEAV